MKASDVRRVALQLPDTAESPHFRMASFRCNGRIFATLTPEGDELNVFVPEEQREQALAIYPGALEKLFWGDKAVGLKIALAKATPAMVGSLLKQAWTQQATKPASARRNRGKA